MLERNERNKVENRKDGNILWKGSTVKKEKNGKRLERRKCMGGMMEKQDNI
jgi:hypothetical protein